MSVIVMYTPIEADVTATTYSAAPEVRVVTRGEELPDVCLGYDSAKGAVTFTRITFSGVFDYRWNYFDLHGEMWNQEDFEFGLIEISDSDWVALLLGTAKRFGYRLGDSSGAARQEKDFRHFRIGFDDHGTYDIVCLDVAVLVCPSSQSVS